ncbi:MAG: hypothetical protein CMP57_01310 [Flavobacteriales bacterium]|nr:hypothetical protein [Flavobacteriales bacterium]
MATILIPFGSIVNALSVILGSFIGISIGNRLPKSIRAIIFQVMGLFTLILGLKMSLETQALIILLLSLTMGAAIGEKLNIEQKLQILGLKIKNLLKNKNEKFAEGLVTAFLLFCLGSMTFVGAIEEGINQDRTLLYTKSFMDGITSILLASSFGLGVLVSAIPLLIFQSLLTFAALYLEPYLTSSIINEVSAVGGVLILGIGINILELKKIKVSNMLPSLFLVVPLHLLFS